jgi:hypothetical protein
VKVQAPHNQFALSDRDPASIEHLRLQRSLGQENNASVDLPVGALFLAAIAQRQLCDALV